MSRFNNLHHVPCLAEACGEGGVCPESNVREVSEVSPWLCQGLSSEIGGFGGFRGDSLALPACVRTRAGRQGVSSGIRLPKLQRRQVVDDQVCARNCKSREDNPIHRVSERTEIIACVRNLRERDIRARIYNGVHWRVVRSRSCVDVRGACVSRVRRNIRLRRVVRNCLHDRRNVCRRRLRVCRRAYDRVVVNSGVASIRRGAGVSRSNNACRRVDGGV